MFKDRPTKPVITHRLAFADMKPGVRGFPTPLDHWIVTKGEMREGGYDWDHDAMKWLKENGYGDKPRKLPVRVDSDRIEDFAVQEYQAKTEMVVRDGKGAPVPLVKDGRPVERNGQPVYKTQDRPFCTGDGETARRLRKDGTWEAIRCCSSPKKRDGTGFDDRPAPQLYKILSRAEKHDPNDGLRCPYAQNKDENAGPRCEPVTELIVRCDAVGNIGSRARYRSHGHETATRVQSSLLDIQGKLPTLIDVPLNLVLSRMMIAAPNGKPGRMQGVAHLELRLPPDETLRVIEANLQQRLRLGGFVEERTRLLAQARAEKLLPEVVSAEFSRKQHPIHGAEGNGVVVMADQGGTDRTVVTEVKMSGDGEVLEMTPKVAP